jgi:ATP-dependent exoDNAse (exonuclease V) alpha subunit
MNQKKALEIMKEGRNVFLTGPAGAGKTHLLNQFIDHLKATLVPVGVTASTGIAATHLHGITIHSWAGFGIKNELTDRDIQNLLKKNYLHARFEDTEVLIIDEVSMLHAHQLDMVDQICQLFKGNDLPFGGIQVVLCGDFFQLPPVRKDRQPTQFIFESKAWDDMNIQICYLDEQHRQKDKSFLNLLNEIRNNHVTEDSLNQLNKQLTATLKKGTKYTRLYTHNADVDAINEFELNKISGESKTYRMAHKGKSALVDSLKRNCIASEALVLKKGAFVMFIKNNFAKGYVNGTLGEIIDFDEDNTPIVRTLKGKRILVNPSSWKIEENDEVKAKITQIPLRLAWAITIHKSQGMSLDAAEIDLSKTFIQGAGYVALSRVKSMNGIKLLGFNKIALKVSPHIVEMDKEFKELSELAYKK